MDATHKALEEIARKLSERHTRNRLIRVDDEPSHVIASQLDAADVGIIEQVCRAHSGRVPMGYFLRSAPDTYEGTHLVVEVC